MTHRVVKLVDDTFLGVTGPVVAWWLSVAHGLPRATNAVQFEKVRAWPGLSCCGTRALSPL